jgi:outer membrane receptor protein involved in Fe transport
VAAAWRLHPTVAVRGAWSSAFRAPTLNELYRSFRVGNVETEHNPGLGAETLSSVEAGMLVTSGRASARLVAYWSTLEDAVTNVTRSVTPALIQRRRENAGRVRARGLELEAEWRAAAGLVLAGSASVIDSRFVEAAEPGLAGRRVPQVPRYQLAASARYVAPGELVASIGLRRLGAQFDDDRNLFLLRPATIVDLYVGRPLASRVTLYAAIENLFDAVQEVGRTPTPTWGLPRTARAGVRVALPWTGGP